MKYDRLIAAAEGVYETATPLHGKDEGLASVSADAIERLAAALDEIDPRHLRRDIKSNWSPMPRHACTCGEAYGSRATDEPKCDYCRLGLFA